jgi:hypothetical protein
VLLGNNLSQDIAIRFLGGFKVKVVVQYFDKQEEWCSFSGIEDDTFARRDSNDSMVWVRGIGMGSVCSRAPEG